MSSVSQQTRSSKKKTKKTLQEVDMRFTKVWLCVSGGVRQCRTGERLQKRTRRSELVEAGGERRGEQGSLPFCSRERSGNIR